MKNNFYIIGIEIFEHNYAIFYYEGGIFDWWSNLWRHQTQTWAIFGAIHVMIRPHHV